MQEGPCEEDADGASSLQAEDTPFFFVEIRTEKGAPVLLFLESSTTVDPITRADTEALVPAINEKLFCYPPPLTVLVVVVVVVVVVVMVREESKTSR